MCDGWTVQEVAAHLAWASVEPPLAAAAEVLRARLNVNRLNDENARPWARRGPTMILDQFQANAASCARPFGVPWPAPVVDAVVHELEPAPTRAALLAAPLAATAALSVGGTPQRRVGMVRLVATDTTWTAGKGPEVHASPETLLLLLAGKTSSSAPGVALLSPGRQ